MVDKYSDSTALKGVIFKFPDQILLVDRDDGPLQLPEISQYTSLDQGVANLTTKMQRLIGAAISDAEYLGMVLGAQLYGYKLDNYNLSSSIPMVFWRSFSAQLTLANFQEWQTCREWFELVFNREVTS